MVIAVRIDANEAKVGMKLYSTHICVIRAVFGWRIEKRRRVARRVMGARKQLHVP
jgi:hypothetical protein